jgi:copper chaperone CopZ
MAVQAPFRVQVTVTGMTCPHCAMSISEALGEIVGVSAVDVDLDSGAVTVLADRTVGRPELAAAVFEAGFELAG